MPMDAPCCMNAQDTIVKRILTVLKNMDMQYRLNLIKELSKIHPAFIDLLDYQLHEPPNPE
jgi:hypothetical protein